MDRMRIKYFLIFSGLAWIDGLTNWFPFYPQIKIGLMGNAFVFIYLLGTAYLIFKHDMLKLNKAIKRTFVYALLTLAISLIYAFFVTLFEQLFQAYVGYSSAVGTFFAALAIAVFFNPLRIAFSNFIDKRFFGKNIFELSAENFLMRSQLQDRDRMKAVATLAAGMAHEIKNPLTVIKTFAEHLPIKYHDPFFREKFSRLVVDEVDRVNNIVTQLLDFSKPAEPIFKSILLSDFFDEILGLLTNNLLKSRINLTKSIDPYAVILGDRNQLKQAFLNILLNGIQSLPEGGEIHIMALRESENTVRISIQDTGCGMTQEQLQRAFDPFYSNREGGSGLGLAIVHGIITKHEGRINMESNLRKGTRVNVFLKSQN
jgi:signal transduction histidine kinase